MSNNTPVKTILILAANPTNTSRLRLDEEVREIEEGLRRANKREQFKLEQKWAVRLRDFYRAMLDYQPQIVHFCGHGAGQDGIVLDNEMGQSALISADALASMFKLFATKGVDCVLLNACYSLVQAEAISQHVNYVIGMTQTVEDQAAVAFAVAFYDAIAAGEEVEFAYELGCSQMIGFLSQQIPVLRKKQSISVTTVPQIEVIPPNPYQGLSAFGEEDAAFFFGRETFVNGLVQATHSQPLVAVIGPSGSGKSSVVFAGLIPQLRSEGNWLIESFRPGNQPFYQLASALVRQLEPEIGETEKLRSAAGLAADIQLGKVTLQQVASRIRERNLDKHLLLFVDQFEELYTLCHKEEQERFVDTLLEVIYHKSITLVFTLRADFYSYVLSYRPFRDALQKFTPQLVSSMSREELLAAIKQPAQKLEVQLEAQLQERILDDVGLEPGNLPLLEFALTRLWSKQQNRLLTHACYDEIGGVKKALANHAQQVYIQLSQTEQKQAQQIFMQLVCPGEATEDTRRIATHEEVGRQNWELVTYLAGSEARLVVTGRNDKSGEETVEIVHEALIREWRTLREWIEANREFLTWQERLRQEMRDWENSNQNPEALLQRTRLAVAEDWYKQRGDELTPRARRFITASIKWRKQEKQKQRRRRQLTIFVLIGILLVTLMLAGNSWWQSQNSVKSEIKAISESSEALFASNQKLDALTEAIRARRKLQNLGIVDAETKNQVELVLRQVVYGAVESNRLQGHGSEVKSAVFSPDGNTLASTSSDKTVILWKCDGTLLTILQGHNAGVLDVAISPDGQTLASASEDKTVKIWKRDGTLLGTLREHRGKVLNVAFSLDGQTLASASEDNTIILWKVPLNKIPVFWKTLKEHKAPVHAVAFSLDGNTIASASDDKTVKLWKRDGTFLTTVAQHNDTVWDVAISPDGKTIVSASGDKTVKISNIEGKLLKTLEGHQAAVSGVAISPDGNTIASASWDKTIKLWNKDGTLLTTLNGHKDRVWKVTFSPDSKILASVSADETIKFWKLDSALLTTLQGHSAPVIGVAISPNDKTVASASDDGTVKLWTQDSTLPVTLDHKPAVYRVAFSPDSSTIASVGVDPTVKLWNKNGILLNTLKGHKAGNWGVAFSPDGNTIASAGWDTTVKLWNKNGTLLNTINGHLEPVWDVTFSPDGNTIASASADMTVKLWKLDGTLLKTLKGHKAGIWGVAISPDGNTIASASDDKTVKLWKRDGTLLNTLKEHQSTVFGVAFSPDGKILASASADKTIKLWKVETGVLLTTLNGHSSKVWRVAFSRDGKTLASASDDKTVILWNLDRVIDINKILAYGCDWARDYLKTNRNVSNSDRTLCDGIGIQR